jgi:co-chaperonin GroES (HSP10)
MSSVYDPVQVKKLRPIKDHVLVSDMEFDVRLTNGGILLLNDNAKSEGIRPRWGQIYAVGPEQDALSVGQWILLSHGRWTRGIKIDDGSGIKTVRRVSNDDILLVSDTKPQDETMSDAVSVHSNTR